MRALLWLFLLITDAASSTTKSWTLSHSLDGGHSFSQRGIITMDATTGIVAIEDQTPLTKSNVEALLAHKWYQLRVESNGGSILTTVPACQVRRANFRDEIELTLSASGDVLSVAYMPLVSPLAPKTCDALETVQANFDTRVSYVLDTPAMPLRVVLPSEKPPPGLLFFPKPKTAPKTTPVGVVEEAEDEDEPVDNSILGFLKRSWYIIVPVLLINLMGGTGQGPEEGTSASQSGTAAVAAAGAAAAATSPRSATGGGGNNKRRGKRG